MLDTKPINTCIVNVHAPTEVSDQNKKDDFYEELTIIYEVIRKDTIRIVMGNTNANCGKE